VSFGLGRGRPLEAGPIGLTADDLPPFPDDPARLADARVDPRRLFPRPKAPLELEIGTGKGAFILKEARRRSDVNFLGVEWAKEFYLYSADRCRRAMLENVRMLHADACEFLRWRAPDACFDVIHLYFSDPWPKKRQHKRRVVQDGFLANAHRTLQPGGELRIVTDHDEYWSWMEDHFARWTAPPGEAAGAERDGRPLFERLPDDEALARIRVADADDEGEAAVLVGTNFERKYAKEGRSFHAAVLRKP